MLSVVLFTAAAWVLYHELKIYPFHEIIQALNDVTALRVSIAAGITLMSYGMMTCYDVLALRYVHHELSYRQIGFASFVGYALSNNIGLSIIAGASVRYRLYSAWGLSTEEITKVVVFCSLTVWLGFLFLGGAVFSAFPVELPRNIHVPLGSANILGIAMLAVVLAYGIGILLRKTPLKIKEWAFEPPPAALVVLQLVVSVIDWLLAAGVLYVLLGAFEQVPFSRYLGFYLMAQLLGIVSQVPGGLGVFETTMVLLLSPFYPAPPIFAALLVFRGIYYWMPLIAAVVFLGGHEYIQHRAFSRRVETFIGKWMSPILPQALGLAAMIGGAILLFSGATPTLANRMRVIKVLMPLPLVELSHFLGSLAGMGLMLLGRGLQRRLDAAWVLSILLLTIGSAASIAKGLDFEEATVLAVIAIAMLPARREFYRKASLFSERLTAGWIASILVVTGASVWLGLFAFKHVEYSSELWWHFSFMGGAPRFMRATVGAMGLALLFSVTRLLRPTPPPAFQVSDGIPEGVVGVVQNSIDTTANLALLGDKRFLFNEARNAFIMYGVSGRTLAAMGDPVGPEETWSDLIWAFKRAAHQFGNRAVFYEVSHRQLPLYLDAGLTLLKLGEEARVPLGDFSLDSSRRKDLRYVHRKVEKQNCHFEVLSQQDVHSQLADLEDISNAWLREKNTREKGFSLGFFSPDYILRFPVAVVRHEGRISAFANIWRSEGRETLTVDLMRYRPEAPRGIMEYLFIEMMLWGRKEGYQWFSLGMAPLAGMENREAASMWYKIAGMVAQFGEHFYNFQGLQRYKQKFDPDWQPKYLACPGGLALPRILTDIGSLVSGGIKGLVMR